MNWSLKSKNLKNSSYLLKVSNLKMVSKNLMIYLDLINLYDLFLACLFKAHLLVYFSRLELTFFLSFIPITVGLTKYSIFQMEENLVNPTHQQFHNWMTSRMTLNYFQHWGWQKLTIKSLVYQRRKTYFNPIRHWQKLLHVLFQLF